MHETTRRGFITGCSAAVAAYAGTRFNTIAFGNPADASDEILVVVFLRGGIDSLNVVLPIAGPDRGYYQAARPNIAVPLTGSNAAIPLTAQLGLHRAADTWPGGTATPPATLYDLYQANKLSLVVACGMHEDNRSHFDSMTFMELGTPGSLTTPTGWLTRHLLTGCLPDGLFIPSLAVGNLQQASLQGSLETLNMSSPDSFSLNVGPYQWRDAQRVALRNIYGATSSWLHDAGSSALDAIDIIEANSSGSYTPANGAVYPGGSLGSHFQTIARMIKLDLGLRVATIDYGGWDTHNGQGDDGGGYFYGHFQELARAMAAFYVDLDGSGAQAYSQRLTVVAMSEFGRRFVQNADRGVDHGHGCMMMVMSGNATGGIRGTWPGLANGQLYQGADLAVTTDYRRVLSEILIRRLGNRNLGEVFPGYAGYTPLGVVNGPDLAPIYGPEIFTDGFEGGNTAAWG